MEEKMIDMFECIVQACELFNYFGEVWRKDKQNEALDVCEDAENLLKLKKIYCYCYYDKDKNKFTRVTFYKHNKDETIKVLESREIK